MKKVVLVGNPNTGKTTLFNTIAKTNEHVGNWHGVTVECKEKLLKDENGNSFVLADIPGTYSLTAFSFEEAVTRDYIFSNQDASFINICDANNLERNLYLTFELLEFGIKPVLCINMANELKKQGKVIDIEKLQKLLGIKVFLIDANNKNQVKNVVKFALKNSEKFDKKLPYFANFENIVDMFLKKQRIIKNLTIFEKLKLCELDNFIANKICLEKQQKDKIFDNFKSENLMQNLIEKRYDYIENIISQTVKCDETKIYGWSKVDKILLNRFLVFPIFLLILSAIFLLTFGKIGTQLTEFLYEFFDVKIFGFLKNFITSKTDNLFVQNFLCQAVFGTLSSLFSFLPQIALMFLGLYILEDSGYMSRLAFCLDDIFNLVGLSGKSIFTLLMGLGCGTTATLTSRDMEDKNSKIKTAILTPYISCTAKLPLYALICFAFFPKSKFIVVISLYLVGIIVALLVSYGLNKTLLPSGEQSFVMELPKYRFPNAKKLSKKILQNIKEFILRVGTILLGFSCIVWILQNCNFKFQYNSGESILMTVSNLISPIFSPLGFGNAGAVASLLCGFVAKEIIVSTIGIVNNVGTSKDIADIAGSLLLSSSVFLLNKSSALSFLIFATLYLPCISTVSVLVKEIGRKWTIFACFVEFLIAYILSFAVYKISTYFCVKGFVSGLLSLFVFLIFLTLIIISIRAIKQKKYCKFCPKQHLCNKK